MCKTPPMQKDAHRFSIVHKMQIIRQIIFVLCTVLLRIVIKKIQTNNLLRTGNKCSTQIKPRKLSATLVSCSTAMAPRWPPSLM